MDDVIKLVSVTYGKDRYGNQIPARQEREVLCKVRSIGRSEYYQAAQTNLHPEYIFVLSHFTDYLGEKELLYRDWTGTEKNYVIIRTYKDQYSDAIELTAEERVGKDGGHISGDNSDSE